MIRRDKIFVIRNFVEIPSMNVLKVSAEFNEKFSISISNETVRRVLKTAEFYGRHASRKFTVTAKNRMFRFLFTKLMINYTRIVLECPIRKTKANSFVCTIL